MTGLTTDATESAVLSPAASKRPLRVVHALGQLQRGGIETWLLHLARRMNTEGIECHVLVRTERDEPYTEDFRRAGITLLPCLGERNPALYFKNFKRIVEQHGPYDILHSHGPSISTLQLSLYAKRLGIPNVLLHSHNDLRALVAKKGLRYRMYIHSLMNAGRALSNHGVACSTLAAEWMYGPRWRSRPKTDLLYIGIEMEPFFAPPEPGLRAELGIPAGRFVLGHVGRYVQAKNHSYLVDIAEAALRHREHFHFLLLGDGPLYPEIEAKIRERGLADHFTLVRDSNRVPAIMTNAMDGFLLPSLHEGLPLSIVEAQAAALPTLAADNITAESIIDARLVKQISIAEPAEVWAQAILEVSDPGYARIPAEEHQRIMMGSRFNIDSSVRAFAALYRRMADENPRRR